MPLLPVTLSDQEITSTEGPGESETFTNKRKLIQTVFCNAM